MNSGEKKKLGFYKIYGTYCPSRLLPVSQTYYSMSLVNHMPGCKHASRVIRVFLDNLC